MNKIIILLLKYHEIITQVFLKKGFLFKTKKGFISYKDYNYQTNNTFDYYSKESYINNEGIIKIYKRSDEIFRSGYFVGVDFSCKFNDFLSLLKIHDIQVYQSEYNLFCRVADLHKIINELYTNINFLRIPNQIRTDITVREKYLDIANRQLVWLENIKYHDLCAYFYLHNPDSSESGRIFSTRKNIEEYGIFANSLIYKEIEWDFDFLEEFKDAVYWEYVIINTNLIFTEASLNKYDKYIPYSKLKDFSIFGELSFEFIKNHIQHIDFYYFFKTAILNFTHKEFNELYDILINLEKPDGYSTHNVFISSVIEDLLDNDNVTWSEGMLYESIHKQPYITLRKCVSIKRINTLLKSFRNYTERVNDEISNYLEVLNKKMETHDYDNYYEYNFLKKESEFFVDFWKKFNNGGEKKYDTYKENFTIQNIQKNITEWENIVDEISDSTRYRWDSLYFNVNAFNVWDFFAKNKEIKLNYELCNFLNSLTIRPGGYYITENGYVSEDYRLKKTNALEFFCDHEFETDEEIIKVLNNKELVDRFMKQGTQKDIPLIEFIIKQFLKECDIEDYISIVNKFQ